MAFEGVLSNRNFRNLWLGQTISQFGDSLYHVTFMFMVAEITKRNDMVGYVGALETLPYLFLGPFAGSVVDRFDRKKVLLASDWASFLILMALAVLVTALDAVPVWPLFVVPFCLSCARTFFLPAKNAAIPNLVPEDKIAAANGLSATTQSIAPMLGLALSAGVLALLYGASPKSFFLSAIILNAATFAGSAYFVAKLPTILATHEEDHAGHFNEVKAGFRYLKTRADLITIVVVSGLVSILISPFYAIYVATNRAWFGGRPETLAWFEFSFFFGMILGGFAVSHMKIRRIGMSFIIANVLIGVAVVFLGVIRNLWSYNFWNVVAGIVLPFSNVPIQSYLQISVEDQYRGRVQSVLTMVTAGAHPIGLSMAGVMIDGVGLELSYWIMGCGMAFASVLGLVSGPFRRATLPERIDKSTPGEVSS